ncbi:hypothetical protein MTO96_008030 [Rhipicephalus appendiculatus]
MSHFCGHVTTQFFGWSSDTKETIQKLYDGILRQYVRSGSSLWSAAGDWLQIADDLLAGPLVTLPTVSADIAEAAVARYEALLKDWPDNYPEVHSFPFRCAQDGVHKSALELHTSVPHRSVPEGFHFVQ